MINLAAADLSIVYTFLHFGVKRCKTEKHFISALYGLFHILVQSDEKFRSTRSQRCSHFSYSNAPRIPPGLVLSPIQMDIKMESKIHAKRSLGDPWGIPGDAWGPPWGLPGGGWDVFRGAAKIRDDFEASRARPGPNSGIRPGPQNQPKMDLWPKRRPRGASPEAFFVLLRFFPAFCQFSS